MMNTTSTIQEGGFAFRSTIAAGGLSGGITSTMAGGDFWDGVCNGLISAGLNHAMHLVGEKLSNPDDPQTDKTSQERPRNHIRLEGKKYFWQLKQHYLKDNGEDVFLTKDQFKDIIRHGKIDYDNAVLGKDGLYEASINLYGTNKDLHYSFGRATVKYQIDNDGNIKYYGFHDEYNFDSKPFGIRSTSAEIITRTFNAITDGTNFHIYYNKIYFTK